MRPRVAVAAEQHRAQGAEGVIVEFGQGANFLQGVEQLQLAAFAEFAEQRLGGAPAHGAEGIEAAGRIAIESFLEQTLRFLRKIGQRKILARPLDLRVVRGELHPQRRVGLGRELQKYRLGAGIAAEHDADVLGLAPAEILEFRDGDRGEMGQSLAMRAGESDALILDMQFVLRRDVHAHAFTLPVVCSGFDGAERRLRLCVSCSPRRIPGSCPRTIGLGSRPRRRECAWRCGRGTSDRAR